LFLRQSLAVLTQVGLELALFLSQPPESWENYN
jgi:hypothetical protein